MQPFREWLRQSRVDISPSIDLIQATDGSHSVCAGQDLTTGVTIARIPTSLVLSQRTSSLSRLLSDTSFTHPGDHELLDAFSQGAEPLRLAVHVCYELLLGSASRWEPFFRVCPPFHPDDEGERHGANGCVAALWREASEEKNWIRGTEVEKELAKTEINLATLEDFYIHMCQPLLISLRPPNSSPSFCLFKHAYTLILTRAFHVDSTYHRLSLVPLACSFNHEQEGESNVQFVVEEEWVCGECGRARACPHDSDNDSQDAMVEERGQGEETWCEMVTTSPVAKGEELFNHYGPRLSNAKLLVSYGFLLEANEHDRLNFDLSDVFDPNLGVEDAETGDPNLGVEDAETGEVEKCWRELLNLCRVSEFKAALEEDHPLVSQPRPLESPHALYADADARLSSPLFLLLAVSVFSTSPSTASVSMNVEKVTKILEAASRCDEGALEGQEEEEESETVTVLHRISERLRKLISRRRAGQNYPNLDAARLLEMAEETERASLRPAIESVAGERLLLERVEANWNFPFPY